MFVHWIIQWYYHTLSGIVNRLDEVNLDTVTLIGSHLKLNFFVPLLRLLVKNTLVSPTMYFKLKSRLGYKHYGCPQLGQHSRWPLTLTFMSKRWFLGPLTKFTIHNFFNRFKHCNFFTNNPQVFMRIKSIWILRAVLAKTMVSTSYQSCLHCAVCTNQIVKSVCYFTVSTTRC